MTGFYGITAYQRANQSWKSAWGKRSEAGSRTDTKKSGVESDKSLSGAGARSAAGADSPGRADLPGSADSKGTAGNLPAGFEAREWSPISAGSSLVPRSTEYGNTIGDVQLSDKANDYYKTLKSKFHNLDFIAVSKDMKAQVQQNAASYGNASKMVVLIDEEKLERMATDESFRKKYEGIIAMSQSRLAEAKNSLASTGASVKNFGMSVDEDGKESFFATVEKSQNMQKKRIEKKAAQKKAVEKKAEKKAAEAKAEKRAAEAKADKKAAEAKANKKAAEAKAENRAAEIKVAERAGEKPGDPAVGEKGWKPGDPAAEGKGWKPGDPGVGEKGWKPGRDASEVDGMGESHLIFEASSMEALISKVSAYSMNAAASHVMTEAEQMLGSRVDFRG